MTAEQRAAAVAMHAACRGFLRRVACEGFYTPQGEASESVLVESQEVQGLSDAAAAWDRATSAAAQ